MERGKRTRSPTLSDAHDAEHKAGGHRKEKEKKEKKEKKSKRSGFETVDTEALLAEQKEADVQRQTAEWEEKAASRQQNAPSTALVVAGTGTASGGGQLTVAGTRHAAQLSQLTRETRRVHVSRLPRGITELDLRATFKVWIDTLRREMINEMLNAKKAGDRLKDSDTVRIDEIVGVYLSNPTEERKSQFAFVELNTPDMTGKLVEASWENKISMNGQGGESCVLTIKRPSNFRDLSTPEPNRMVITSPPATVDESNWRLMCGKLGTFVEDQFFCVPGKYVYVEYEEEGAAEKAVSRLSGLVFQGTVLLVQLANPVHRVQLINLGCDVRAPEDDPLTNPAAAAGMNGEKPRDMIKEFLDLETNATKVLQLLGREYSYLKSAGALPVIPTRILVLYNLVDPKDEFVEDDDYYNFKQDVSDQVEQYGRVEQLLVPRFPPVAPKPPAALELPPMPTFNPAAMITAGPNAAASTADGKASPAVETKSAEQLEYERLLEARATMERAHQLSVEAYQKARLQWEADLDDPVKCGIGRVFVEYATADEALHAQQQIAGRLFNGRTVITSFLQEDIMYPPTAEEEDGSGDDGEEGGGQDAATAAGENGEVKKNSGDDGDAASPTAKKGEESDEARNARMAALVTETEDID